MNMMKERNEFDRKTVFTIEVLDEYLAENCEPYGPPELCELITEEQGRDIVKDAILMAMHLKKRAHQ